MRIPRTAACLAVPLALGLGPAAAAQAPAPASAPRAAATVTLTNSDNGRVVHVRTDDTVTVRLSGSRARGVTWVWSTPTAADPALLGVITANRSPGGDATAEFRARRAGTTDVNAYRACRPDPGRVCAQVVFPWKATIVVENGRR
ncbi:hypothetical protein AB0K09_33375 [Streptomyces sp. NPDC049577]|uniref:hypothetical protein n=1 Tax=Streptomyces sp. NPDC049577 TaxID=3155153 RepID=UPI0034435C58